MISICIVSLAFLKEKLSRENKSEIVIKGYDTNGIPITLYNLYNLVSIHSISMLESRKQQNNNLHCHVSRETFPLRPHELPFKPKSLFFRQLITQFIVLGTYVAFDPFKDDVMGVHETNQAGPEVFV